MRGVLPALTLGIEIKSDWRWKLSCKLIHKLKKIKNFCLWPSVLFSWLFFGHTCRTWKFPGQGLNLCHSCDLGCYRDKAGSLTQCQKGTPFFYWLNKSYLLVLIIGAKMYIGMCYYWPAMCFKVLESWTASWWNWTPVTVCPSLPASSVVAILPVVSPPQWTWAVVSASDLWDGNNAHS